MCPGALGKGEALRGVAQRAPPQTRWAVQMQPQLWEPREALPAHPDLCDQGGTLALKSSTSSYIPG